MRSGLSLAGAQRCFQFPAQAFGFLFQALDLLAQPLVFLLRSIQLWFRNKLNALRLLVCGGPTNWSHPTLRYPKPHLLSSRIFGRRFQRSLRLVNQYTEAKRGSTLFSGSSPPLPKSDAEECVENSLGHGDRMPFQSGCSTPQSHLRETSTD